MEARRASVRCLSALSGAGAIGRVAQAPDDNFRWRFHGLFHVAPAQDGYMCRLRLPNGILDHWQLAGVAGLAERRGGGHAHVTTRANLQIREVAPVDAPDLVEGSCALGIVTKGSGADNIRNVTGHATAGIDPQEYLDTRPHARDLHHHILNDRSLYGLPRKFNVGFDGGGMIPTLEETNDIGFQAVMVGPGGAFDGAPVAEGVWYRLAIGGITGHKDLARDTGAILRPDEATEVADAIVRVFIDEGDRTNRAKARLKYVLDAWGGCRNSSTRSREGSGVRLSRSMRLPSHRARRTIGSPISASTRRSRQASTGSAWRSRSAA